MKRKTKAELREMQVRSYRAAKRQWHAVPVDERPAKWSFFVTVRECLRAIRWVLHCRKGQQAALKRWEAAKWRPERIEKARGGNG